MCRRRRGLALRLLAHFLVCALWASTASAHSLDPSRDSVPDAATQPIGAAPFSPSTEAATVPAPTADAPATDWGTAGAVLLGVLLLGLGVVRWPLMAMRLVLAALMVVAASETAVHSVHHLDSPQGGATCQVLTVTQQLHAETSPELPSGVPVIEFRSHVGIAQVRETAQSIHRLEEGRAPPLPLPLA